MLLSIADCGSKINVLTVFSGNLRFARTGGRYCEGFFVANHFFENTFGRSITGGLSGIRYDVMMGLYFRSYSLQK